MLPKRVLLVEPPFHRLYKPTYSLTLYPLGLGYLAGAIKKDTDWDVMVYNADFTPKSEYRELVYETGPGFYKYLDNLKNPSAEIWDEIRSVIKEFQPSVLGISAKTQNFRSAAVIARIAKEIDKNIIVVLGGAHPSMAGEDVLACSDIDICVVGEGEKTIVNLLEAIDHRGSFETIKGIIYRAEGKIVKNAPQEYIQDLDALCFPHEHAPALLKDYTHYPKEAFSTIFATRGCPHNCVFCGSRMIWSRKGRYRSPGNVAREIKQLQGIGLKMVSFEDDYFGVNEKYVFDLCEAILEQCPGVKWACEIHVKLVNDRTIGMMKRAGCFSIRLGVESGNNEILKIIRKNITIEEALTACKTIKKHGIEVHVFFMIGFPQETEKTLLDTMNAMKRIKCDSVIYSVFTPYPGTEAFNLCKEQGTVTDDYDVALYNHQSPLNYFCPSIPRDRFRALAGKMESMIDRRNWLNRIKRVFSLSVFWRIKERGLWESFCAGMRLIRGK